MTFTLNIVIAMANNFLFGTSDNKLPWPKENYKEDLQHFRKLTSNTTKINYLICGFRTYLSMKGLKLKNRRLIVINRDAINLEYTSENGPIMAKNFDIAIKLCKEHVESNICDKVFVIGGRKCIEEAMNSSENKKLYLTLIKKSFKNGDVFLNPELFEKCRIITSDKIRDMQFCEYDFTNKRHSEYQYLDVIQRILDEGIDCDDRTGVGIRSIFGVQMHFDLSKEFPLLTTKKMFTRGITEELLWFLRGETDAKILQEKNVHIWDGNSTRDFLDKVGLHHLEEGDIGAAYGFQFRHFGTEYKDCHTDYSGKGFDQVEYVLNEIKNNPNSRRILLSLWNPPYLKKAVLPPCHLLYHFRVYNDTLSCSMYQRSGDIGLGVPFNIASASLMTYLFAHLTGLKPGKLVHTIGDAHIYNNHLEAMKTQIQRKPLPFPQLKIKNREQKKVEDYMASDFEVLGYISYDRISMDMAV